MNNCFEKLNITIPASHSIYEECKHFEYNIITNVLGKKTTFPQYNIQHPEIYFKGEAILDLIKEYQLSAKIFSVSPGWCYTWHKDKFREWSVNLNLSGGSDNLTMFAHEFPNGLRPVLSFEEYTYFPYTKLTYEPNTAYLINTQIPHCSINFGSEPRYFLTLGQFVKHEVESSKNLTVDLEGYKKLITSLKSNNFI
jgi:hypothetical protein